MTGPCKLPNSSYFGRSRKIEGKKVTSSRRKEESVSTIRADLMEDYPHGMLLHGDSTTSRGIRRREDQLHTENGSI